MKGSLINNKMNEIKLQKYFTDCGIMSRRAAEAEIERGHVRVNGEVATLGMRIDPERDTVEYNDKPVIPTVDEKICIMLNKPRGFVTTMSDEKGRPTVRSLTEDVHARVYPIGRLDMDSDGLLLLTNDGRLAEGLTHPKHTIPKIYRVTVTKNITDAQLCSLRSPMRIDGYKIQPVKVNVLSRDELSTVLEMTLFEGRNRQIRKMCEQVGLKITRLCRVAIGDIRLGSLSQGRWRRLSKKELEYLYASLNNAGQATKRKENSENA